MNKIKIFSQIASKNSAISAVCIRNASHWNKDFKPGKYPETEAERVAAAKKYNLLPEEYKPYADDGLGYGDYPQLPNTSGEAKDNYYPYDFPELKRNLHEPVHADLDLYGEDRYGSAEPLRYPMKVYWMSFLGVMTGCFVLYYWLEDKKMFRPVIPKQLPIDGVHYTFERK
jgi:NADH dehydrogenase (ubiquinone) 1 beta subcomplex subunit 8